LIVVVEPVRPLYEPAVPQQRSSTAVWLTLALIVASCVAFGLGVESVQAAKSHRGLSAGVFVLYIGSLLGSMYFTVRLGFAGLMVILGKPINRTVAWMSATGAKIHGAIVLALVIATIVLAPPQGFMPIAVGLVLAQIALFLMGQYPNLAESQGWEIEILQVHEEPIAAPPATRPRPRPISVRPNPAPVVIAPIAPPIQREAPRATAASDGSEPSMLR
jgi:hypothetical protein